MSAGYPLATDAGRRSESDSRGCWPRGGGIPGTAVPPERAWGQRVAGGSAARVTFQQHCDAVPRRLLLRSPSRHGDLAGMYTVVPGETLHEQPIWRQACGDGWLFSGPDDRWHFDVSRDGSAGLLASSRPHGGNFPVHTLTGGWLAWDGTGYARDTSLQILRDDDASSRKKPPLHRRFDDFDGAWQQDGQPHQIRGVNLQWPDGSVSLLRRLKPDLLLLDVPNSRGRSIRGHLEDGGTRLEWSDGTAWHRDGRVDVEKVRRQRSSVERSVREALLRRAAREEYEHAMMLAVEDTIPTGKQAAADASSPDLLKEIDGAWECRSLLYVISSGRLVWPSGALSEIQRVGPRGISVQRGALVLRAHLEDAGMKLQWTSGDAWHRDAHAAADAIRLRHQVASVDDPWPAQLFDGSWYKGCDKYVIWTGELTWPNGKVTEFWRTRGDQISVHIPQKGMCQAVLLPGGRHLEWSNGSIWVRDPVLKAEQMEAHAVVDHSYIQHLDMRHELAVQNVISQQRRAEAEGVLRMRAGQPGTRVLLEGQLDGQQAFVETHAAFQPPRYPSHCDANDELRKVFLQVVH